MFKKGRVKKASVSIPKRKWKGSRLPPKEWDSSLSDLTVHKASEEEVQRRRLVHRSKNAGAARRALGERAKRLFLDPSSPGQVELEMKKLAILKEVLYDHDDLNEVLKRVDNTMSSVKTIFHEAPYRKSGNPVVTLAPGTKSSNGVGPVKMTEEPSTQMSLLSDSVMDKQALNDELSSSEDDCEEDKFESKVDYDRFLNVLRESLNKSFVPPKNTESACGDTMMTPLGNTNQKSEKQRLALNCTEEVKRTMSRFVGQNEDLEKEEKSTRKTIDDTISKMASVRSIHDVKKKNQSVSFFDDNTLPLRANLTANNMTYENLKEAMDSVSNNLAEMDIRRGNNQTTETANISSKSDGLAGFTVTLIDAVTRLTVYINEAETKLLENETLIETLKNQSDHQRALLDALTAELMGMQDQIRTLKDDASQQKEDFQTSQNDFSKTMQQDMKELKDRLENMEKVQHENINAGGDAGSNNDIVPSIGNLQFFEGGDNKTIKEREDKALKSDMLSLLGALKSEVSGQNTRQEMTAAVFPSMNNQTTKDAAQTVASVESQLKHLQLQHTEAQNRLQELTQVAGFFAGKVAESDGSQISTSGHVTPTSSASYSIASRPLTPQNYNDNFQPMIPSHGIDETDDSISGITITSSMFANAGGDTSRPSVQSSNGARVLPLFNPRLVEDTSSSRSIDCVNISDNSFLSLDKNSIPMLLQSNIFGMEAPSKDDDDDDFQQLYGNMEGTLAALPSFKPTSMTNIRRTDPQNVTNSIQQTQCNLEDRIAELNKQHAEAQSRLHNLIRKRSDIQSPSERSSDTGSSRRVIQVTIPTDDMLKTPQVYRAPEPFRPFNLAEDSFT